MTETIDTEAMIADAKTMPRDREGIIAWHMERGSTREQAEHVAARMLDTAAENVDH